MFPSCAGYMFVFFFSSRRPHTISPGDWSSDVCSSDLVVFLELRRDSRVTTGHSGCLLCWPRQVQSSMRVAKESWGLLSSDCRANRPHPGLCPEANVPLQGRQGSRGCNSRRTRGDRHSSRVEVKKPALLSSRDGYLWDLTGWTQGSQAS